MISKENEKTLLYLKFIIQPKQHNNTRLPAEHKTRPPTRYNFTPFLLHNNQQNMLILGQGESQHLANLLYHVLGVSYYFHPLTKINLLQLKNLTFSGDSPTCWCHSLILSYVSENSKCQKLTTLVFSRYHSKFLHISLHLHAWWNTTDLYAIADMSNHVHR